MHAYGFGSHSHTHTHTHTNIIPTPSDFILGLSWLHQIQ